MSQVSSASRSCSYDISRIGQHAPAELIGREDEIELLNDAWTKARNGEATRPRILTFVALGGEGKTSLIAKWAADLEFNGWQGCDAAFAWSFYSQGTREQTAVSSDLFLFEALTFFGGEEMARSVQSAHDKGRKLAQLIGARRALLILDGLEPLQYAPTSPMRGELKDQGLAALLKGLTSTRHGMCIVNTRYKIPDLRVHWEGNAPMYDLLRLSPTAGVTLLQRIGVIIGSQAAFENLVEDVKGHALTLNLLGTYLRDAHAGDIRKRDLVQLKEADERGHASRVMDAYVKWFQDDGEKGYQALAVLRCLGLFDRPATADCFAALRKAPVIPGMTKMLVVMSETELNLTLSRLQDARLLTANITAAGSLASLDTHPLIRDYFSNERRDNHVEGWRAAHQRIYEHLCATTREGPRPTLAELQPLYQAIGHGCHAGLQEDVRANVYRRRIGKEDRFYSSRILGAFGSDLGAIACFFKQPWNRLSAGFSEANKAWLLQEASSRLRGLGRVMDAIEPRKIGLEMEKELKLWSNAAVSAAELAEMEIILGNLDCALAAVQDSEICSVKSTDIHQQVGAGCTRAYILHQKGEWNAIHSIFSKCENLQANHPPGIPLLCSISGFKYCQFLLKVSECAAAKITLQAGCSSSGENSRSGPSSQTSICYSVIQRATQMSVLSKLGNLPPLTIALNHLIIGQASLYESILNGTSVNDYEKLLQDAMTG